MKAFGIFLTTISSIMITASVITCIIADYSYKNNYASYWELADKSSTIEKKQEYIDKFVEALKSAGLEGEHNAVWLTTPDNSFDRNIEALESLQLRLNEIKTMDIRSFEYQTAIQQITAQEQGEAQAMIKTLKGIWWKKHHFFTWSWLLPCNILFCIVVIIIGLCMILSYDYD